MKKIQLLTSIILTLLMIIAPQSIALAADDSSQASAVSLISDGFSVDKKAIYAGDTFKLKYKIKNTNSKFDIKNLNMRLSGGDTFTVQTTWIPFIPLHFQKVQAHSLARIFM